jgi:hypothetical protein
VFGPRFSKAAFGARAAAAGLALSLLGGPTLAEEMTHTRLASIMDGVFGRGAWRMTGGYRTPQREDELRAQGAKTVRPGGTSRHSLGRPGAPGAYDVVVDGMSPGEAANRLRQAGAPFARYQPKGTHGSQGPHLHLEPYGFGPTPGPQFQMAANRQPKVEEGRRRSVTLVLPATSAKALAAYRQELARLQNDAEQASPEAQLELGRAYALGYIVARDFATAQSWLDAAAANPDADDDTQAAAKAALAEVTALLEAEHAQQPARIARLKASAD